MRTEPANYGLREYSSTTMPMLIAAPAAEGYYRKIGMRPIKSGWLIPRDG